MSVSTLSSFDALLTRRLKWNKSIASDLTGIVVGIN
jgi:hypothetical protein